MGIEICILDLAEKANKEQKLYNNICFIYIKAEPTPVCQEIARTW